MNEDLKNIDYCERALKVYAEILDNGKTHFTYNEGESIAGCYWMPIADEMERHKAGYSDYGAFTATVMARLLKLRAETQALLIKRKEEKALYDTSIKEKIENIKYGKRGFHTSIVALILSLLAILTEIALRIWLP